MKLTGYALQLLFVAKVHESVEILLKLQIQ